MATAKNNPGFKDLGYTAVATTHSFTLFELELKKSLSFYLVR